MTQQVEVRLANGGREVFSASAWVCREDGGLDVLSADNSAPLATVATFARGEWAFASKVVIEGQVDGDKNGETCRRYDGLVLFKCTCCEQAYPIADEGPTDGHGKIWCQACADEARSQG